MTHKSILLLTLGAVLLPLTTLAQESEPSVSLARYFDIPVDTKQTYKITMGPRELELVSVITSNKNGVVAVDDHIAVGDQKLVVKQVRMRRHPFFRVALVKERAHDRAPNR